MITRRIIEATGMLAIVMLFAPVLAQQPVDPEPLVPNRNKSTSLTITTIPVDREEATHMALDLVEPDLRTHGLSVYRFPDILPAGATIGDGGEETVAVLEEDSWLLYVDDAPLAQFGKPGRVVLIGAVTGALTVHLVADQPYLNGTFPLFGDGGADPSDPDVAVFSYPEEEGIYLGAEESEPEDVTLTPQQVLPFTLADDELVCESDLVEYEGYERGLTYAACGPDPALCGRRWAILLKGRPYKTRGSNGNVRLPQWDGQDIATNVKEMEKALTKHGFIALTIDLGAKNGLDKLSDTIYEINEHLGCSDEVFVYYTGHAKSRGVYGTPADKKKDVLVDSREHYLAPRSGKKIYGSQLRDILKELHTCNLHIAIDACYSGGLVKPLKAVPGLASIATSSTSKEKAWVGRIDRIRFKDGRRPPVSDAWGRAHGEKGSEYSSGYIRGLVEAKPGTPAKALFKTAHDTAVKWDVAAKAKITHPTYGSGAAMCECVQDAYRMIGAQNCSLRDDLNMMDDTVPAQEDPLRIDTVNRPDVGLQTVSPTLESTRASGAVVIE